LPPPQRRDRLSPPQYHHCYRVPHSVPGRPPKGSVSTATPAEFLTVCLAGHQKEVSVLPVLHSSSQCAWQATNDRGKRGLSEDKAGGDAVGVLFCAR
jgi:hypothetical protein